MVSGQRINSDLVVTSLVAPKAQHLRNGLHFILINSLPAPVAFCFSSSPENAVLFGYLK